MKNTPPKKNRAGEKLIVGLCALMAVVPVTKLANGLYRKDPQAVNTGLVASALGCTGFGLSVLTYAKNSARKKDD